MLKHWLVLLGLKLGEILSDIEGDMLGLSDRLIEGLKLDTMLGEVLGEIL